MNLSAGTAYLDIAPRLARDFGNDLSRQVGNPVDDTAKRAGSSIGGLATKLAGVAAGAFAGVQITKFFGDAISGASDFNESLSKVGVVFGAQAPKIEAFAKTAATALGQSQNQALAAAGTFGNLFTALGLTQTKSADMSTSLVTLASDLASFNNVDPAEALDALRAGLAGEAEPLKKFGVNMNDATLKAQAMKMGLIASEKEALTPAAKAQAAYALILAQTTTAQGDFARTSDGLANKQRILAARFEDVKARVGQALLPVMLNLTTLLADSLEPAFKAISDVVVKVGNAFKFLFEDGEPQGFAEILDNLLGNSGEYIGFFKGLGQVILDVTAFVRDNLKPILIGLGVVLLGLISPVALVIAGLVALYLKFDEVRAVLAAVAGFITTQVGALVDYVKGIWPQVSETISHVMNVVQGVIRTTIDVVSAWWRAWGDDLARIVGTVWNGIRETIENALQLIRGIIQTVLAVLNGDWGKAWDGIKNIVGAVWDQIGNIISTAIGTVRSLLGGMASTVAEIARGIWEPIKEAFKGVVNWVIRAWNDLDFTLPSVEVFGKKVGGFTIGGMDIPELRERGGSVIAGRNYVIGEKGPEVVRFGANGHVFPNNTLRSVGGDQAPPIIGGDLVLNAARMEASDVAGELYWLKISRGY